ncbi:MAG: hypothetical protein KAH13_03700 [Tenericutes bacterium]|nr:hypothetical protein [Mycoplasmatota bacterium]
MRVFGRFLYALLAVGFFLLAFTYSKDLMMTKYLEDVFGESLIDEDSEFPKYYYFYTSIPNYHNDTPIISIESNGYEIMGYEVLRVYIDNDDELVTEESIYLIVYSDTEDLSQVGYLYLENSTSEEAEGIGLQRFKTLNILNGINEYGTIYVVKDTFLEGNYDKIYLINQLEFTLVEEDFNVEEADFTIKAFIEDFYSVNNRLPTIDDLSDLSENNIFPNKPHVATDYAHIFYIAMGIYFIIIIFMTYIIYFRKKRKKY